MAEQQRPVYRPENNDLGFGSVVSNQPRLRLLNRDGSFNVVKRNKRGPRSWASYHRMLTISWPKFFAVLMAVDLVANLLFACAYYSLGPEALHGEIGVGGFWRAFFFSVYSSATIGYGNVVPVGVWANVLVAAEALVGLLSCALGAALLFARFSRPIADILYSRQAVVAPYRGITALEFRIVNARENQLIEMHARVAFSRFEVVDGRRVRVFTTLALERESVSLLPLNWTVVHPIDRQSPLFGWTREKLIQSDAEFLVLLTALDETFSQPVHSRSSYTAEEIAWEARFAPMYEFDQDTVRLDISRLDHIVPAESPAAADD